jgi:RES domain
VPTARFDHHLAVPATPERRVLYAATRGPTCIAEVFQATRTIDATTRAPWLVGFRLSSEVHLLDLASTWPTAAGASSAINTGSRSRARQWSRTIYEAYPTLHGLWYASSMYANAPAVALYERAEHAVPSVPFFHRPLDDPALYGLLRNVARIIRYRLVIRWAPSE